jgi:hypothetical protein
MENHKNFIFTICIDKSGRRERDKTEKEREGERRGGEKNF